MADEETPENEAMPRPDTEVKEEDEGSLHFEDDDEEEEEEEEEEDWKAELMKGRVRGQRVFTVPSTTSLGSAQMFLVIFALCMMAVAIGVLFGTGRSSAPSSMEMGYVEVKDKGAPAKKLAADGTIKEHIVDLEHRGGRGDGVFDNTELIQEILEECREYRCTFVIPAPGTYLTGAINLVSHLTLQIERGASLLFIPDPHRYPTVPYPEHPSRSSYPAPRRPVHSPLIRAYNLTEVRVTGGGIIDGNGEWHSWEHEAPVATLYILGCKDFVVSGVKFEEMVGMAMHMQYSIGVKVEDVEITAKDTPYADGILVDSSMLVETRRLKYRGGGLAYAIAAGDGYEGRAVNIATKHVLLADSTFDSGRGVGMLSAMAGGYQNITYRNLFLDGTLSRSHGESKSMGGVRIKSKAEVTGGRVEDITFENIYGKSLHHGIQIDMFKHMSDEYIHARHSQEDREGKHSGSGLKSGRKDKVYMHRITFRNITVDNIEDDCGALEILADSPVHGVLMEDVSLRHCHKPWKCGPGHVFGEAINVNPPLPPGCMQKEEE